MSPWKPYAAWHGFESEHRLRKNRRGRFKDYDVRNRTAGGCTSKRTMDKLYVTSRMVVREVRGHLGGGNGCGADLQQKRRTVGGHKANGHIRTKQQEGQQQAGHQIAPAIVKKALPHVCSLYRFKADLEG
jgi:hypothetical protein